MQELSALGTSAYAIHVVRPRIIVVLPEAATPHAPYAHGLGRTTDATLTGEATVPRVRPSREDALSTAVAHS